MLGTVYILCLASRHRGTFQQPNDILCFTGEETEAQRGELPHGHTPSEWWRQDVHLANDRASSWVLAWLGNGCGGQGLGPEKC